MAHSMGGLIVAGYLAERGFTKVDKVATLASPFRGSIEAIAKTALGTGGFSIGSGGSREREAARVTPSLSQLLPSYDRAILPARRDIFLPENWQPGIRATLASFVARHSLVDTNADRLLGAMLDRAWEHRTRMETLTLPDPRRWLYVVGVGAETRLNMTITNDAKGAPTFTLGEATNQWKTKRPSTSTGDATVPYFGARCAFVPTEQIVCVSPGDFEFFELGDKLISQFGFHGAIPSMNLVQRLVVTHLMGRPQGTLGGHPSPEIDRNDWAPPIPGLT